MKYLVAKSYQDLPQIGEAFISNNKTYIQVQTKKGNIKTVRVYTDKEYQKAYPNKEAAAAGSVVASTQKEALGFSKGYITIFKGDTYPHLEWFQKKKECRYTRYWGWYVVSTEEVPEDLPEGIAAVRLLWERVGLASGALKPETAVKQAVEELIYDAGSSEWVGKVGERLDLTLTVIANHTVENAYGTGHSHYFEDANGNLYGWFTNAKDWAVGETKTIRGTVKELSFYRNQKITWLTRCQEVKGK